MQNKKENKEENNEKTEGEEPKEAGKNFSDRFSEEQINDFLEAFHVFDKGILQTFMKQLYRICLFK